MTVSVTLFRDRWHIPSLMTPFMTNKVSCKRSSTVDHGFLEQWSYFMHAQIFVTSEGTVNIFYFKGLEHLAVHRQKLRQSLHHWVLIFPGSISNIVKLDVSKFLACVRVHVTTFSFSHFIIRIFVFIWYSSDYFFSSLFGLLKTITFWKQWIQYSWLSEKLCTRPHHNSCHKTQTYLRNT